MRIFAAVSAQDVLDKLMREIALAAPKAEVMGFRDGTEVLFQIRQQDCDVLFIGMEMLSVNGVNLTKSVKEASPDTAIFFVEDGTVPGDQAKNLPSELCIGSPITAEKISGLLSKQNRDATEVREGLLDRLWDRAGCTYLSDLKYMPKKRMQRLISGMDVERYTVEEWDEVICYMTGCHSHSSSGAEAKALLLDHLKE